MSYEEQARDEENVNRRMHRRHESLAALALSSEVCIHERSAVINS